MERKRKFVFTLYAYTFMIGFAVSGTMFSTVLPRMIQDYRLTLAQAGLFSVFISSGNLIAMVITGILGDKYRKSVLMGGVFLGMSIMLFLIGSMPPFPLLLCFLVFLGVCSSILNLIVTAYVSDLYGDDRAKYINLVHMFYGIGSLAGPLYPMLLSRIGLAWKFSYLFLAGIVMLIGISYFIVMKKIKEPNLEAGKPADKGNPGGTNEDWKGLFRYKGMIALCAMSFLYMGGHQNTFSTWFQTYLQTENTQIYTEGFTSVCMTLYWIGMVASRTISASVSNKIAPREFILAGSLGGVAAMALGMLAQTPWAWVAAVVILGVCTGAVYPLTFAISCSWFPDASAKVSSVVGVFTSVGSMFCGWVVGKIANSVSFRLAMLIPWVSLAAVFLIVWRCFPKPQKDFCIQREKGR